MIKYYKTIYEQIYKNNILENQCIQLVAEFYGKAIQDKYRTQDIILIVTNKKRVIPCRILQNYKILGLTRLQHLSNNVVNTGKVKTSRINEHK